MVKNSLFEDLKRRNQNKEFSFPFFVGFSPDPSTEKVVVRKNSLVLVPSGARQRGAQNYHAIRAYDLVQNHHALRACKDQSLRDCLEKKVRAKVMISSHKEKGLSDGPPRPSMRDLLRGAPVDVCPLVVPQVEGEHMFASEAFFTVFDPFTRRVVLVVPSRDLD